MIAVLLNPTSPTTDSQLKNLQAAANALGVRLHTLHASTERDFNTVFETLVQLRPGGLVVASDTFFATQSEQLAALTIRHSVPAIHQSRDFTIAGGLMSYAGSFMESHRQAGIQTGRILKGDKPVDLPVQQVTKVELFINLKAAKTLGITFPLSLLGRADEVIEMRRREFIMLLSGATLLGGMPLAARAQQSAMPVIGFLNTGTAAGYVPFAAAFRKV
jgi:putative ABC transport system substrate-binding protein